MTPLFPRASSSLLLLSKAYRPNCRVYRKSKHRTQPLLAVFAHRGAKIRTSGGDRASVDID